MAGRHLLRRQKSGAYGDQNEAGQAETPLAATTSAAIAAKYIIL
jgi:hypothetical protein